MNLDKPLPTNLGGYQAVCNGPIMDGDLIVFGCMPDLNMAWAHFCVGQDAEKTATEGKCRIYRKSPVMKQGDIDHGQEVPLKPTAFKGVMESVREIAATHDDGKPPLAFLPTAGLRAVAQVQAYGHKKYHDFHNFRKGIQHSRAISCAMRHLAAHMDGETVDPESGQLHISHAACRLLFLIQNINDGTAIDDRYKKE